MAISKIVYKSSASATPEVWMDVTQDTVTTSTLLSSYTATKNDGTKITGEYEGVSLQSKSATFTPTTSTQTSSILPDSGYALSSVGITVNPIPSAYIIPTGTLSISQNGSGIDVASYASVDVSVSGGGGIQKTLTFTSVPDDTNYSSVTYNSITYDRTNITEGMTLNVTTGDKIYLYCNLGRFGCEINVDGVQVAYSEARAVEYEYTVIDTNIEISFFSGADNSISIKYPKLNITQNGTYNVSSYYYASVAVEGTAGADEIIQRTITGAYTNSGVQKVGYYAFCSCSALTAVSFPNCTSLEYGAFSSCTNLSTVSLPELTTLSTMAFSGCYKLETVYIPDISIIPPYAFYNCSSLKYLTTAPITSISSSAFYACGNLSNVTFSTSISSIGGGAFWGAGFSELNFSFVSNILAQAFTNCKNLTELTIDSINGMYSSAFRSCSKLTTVSIKHAGASLFNYGTSVFANCTSLSSVYISVNTSIAFYSIATGAFYGCTNLNWVCLTGARSFVGTSIFYNCYNLLSLYILTRSTTTPTLGNVNAFTNTPISTRTTSTGGVYGSIFVPASMYSSYIEAANWVTYSDRFVSMTDAEIEAFLSNLT